MSDEKMLKMFSDLKGFISNEITNLREEQKTNFEKINKRFDEHEKQQKIDFEKINKRLDEHEKQQKIDFENLEKKFNKKIDEHQRQQELDYDEIIKFINGRFKSHEEEQRENFAKLEHIMFERTAILFDAQKISEEANKKIKSEFKSVYRILDAHNHRIYELESKAK